MDAFDLFFPEPPKAEGRLLKGYTFGEVIAKAKAQKCRWLSVGLEGVTEIPRLTKLESRLRKEEMVALSVTYDYSWENYMLVVTWSTGSVRALLFDSVSVAAELEYGSGKVADDNAAKPTLYLPEWGQPEEFPYPPHTLERGEEVTLRPYYTTHPCRCRVCEYLRSQGQDYTNVQSQEGRVFVVPASLKTKMSPASIKGPVVRRGEDGIFTIEG